MVLLTSLLLLSRRTNGKNQNQCCCIIMSSSSRIQLLSSLQLKTTILCSMIVFYFLIVVTLITKTTTTTTMTDAFPIISVPQQKQYTMHNILCKNIHLPKQQQQRLSSSSSLSFIKSNFLYSMDQIRCAVIPTPYFAENNNNNKNDDNNNNNNNKSNPIISSSSSINNNSIDDDMTTGTTSSSPTTNINNNNNKSILQMIDEMAQQIKIAALQANAKAALYTNTDRNTIITLRQRIQQYKYYIQSILYYILFLMYRSYRGFFIILPAVYKETYNKLQYVIDNQPFEYNNNNTNNNNNNNNNIETTVDGSDTTTNSLSSSSSSDTTSTTNTTNQLNLRTRIVISIISTFIIVSYVTSGAIRVLQSFISSLLFKHYTIPQSLQNAIQQQEENEIILLHKNKK